jgi:glycosyltransferase involved in cell wall biosynthesis
VFGNEGHYKRWHLPGLFATTLRLIKDADIVVGANEGRATFIPLVAAGIIRRPFVAWLHNNWESFGNVVSWRQHLSLRQYDRASVVVAASDGVAQAFSRMVRLSPGKIQTIRNAVSGEHIIVSAAEPLPQQHARIFEQKTVLSVGRLDYQKNHELLIQSHSLLRAWGVQHELVLLGEGPLKERLSALARDLQVQDSVHFLGFQKNPYVFMANATVFALSSRFEGLPLVVAEALFVGTPVVSVDCPSGPSEILENGRDGVLVAPNSPEQLARALERVLNDAEERERLSRVACERSRDFDLPSAIGRWATMLENIAP